MVTDSVKNGWEIVDDAESDEKNVRLEEVSDDGEHEFKDNDDGEHEFKDELVESEEKNVRFADIADDGEHEFKDELVESEEKNMGFSEVENDGSTHHQDMGLDEAPEVIEKDEETLLYDCLSGYHGSLFEGKIDDGEGRITLRKIQELSHDKKNRAAMLQAGVVPHLLSIVQKDNNGVRIAFATASIQNLSAETKNQVEMCEISCTILVNFIDQLALSEDLGGGEVDQDTTAPAEKIDSKKDHAKNYSCLCILTALVWLSSNEANHSFMVAHGTVSAMSNVLDYIIKKNTALDSATSSSLKHSRRLKKWREWSQNVHLVVARLLHNLSSATDAKLAIEAGLLEPLISLLESALESEGVMIILFRAFLKLTHFEGSLQPIITSRFIPVFKQLVDERGSITNESLHKASDMIAILAYRCTTDDQARQRMQDYQLVGTLSLLMNEFVEDFVELRVFMAMIFITEGEKEVPDQIAKQFVELLEHSARGEPFCGYTCDRGTCLTLIYMCSLNDKNARALHCPLLLTLLAECETQAKASQERRNVVMVAATLLKLRALQFHYAISFKVDMTHGKNSGFRVVDVKIGRSVLVGDVRFFEVEVLCTNAQEWVVHRRFNDFQHLERLTAKKRSRMPDFPPLWSPSAIMDKDAFLNTRQKGLEIWTRALVMRCHAPIRFTGCTATLGDIVEAWLRVPELWMIESDDPRTGEGETNAVPDVDTEEDILMRHS